MQSLLRTSLTLGLAVVSLGMAACASSPPEDGLVAADDSQKVVCRNEAKTGSRMAKKVCRTQGEWDEIAAENKEMRQSLQKGSTSGGISDGSRQ